MSLLKSFTRCPMPHLVLVRTFMTLILRKNLGFQFCAVSYNLKVVVSSPYQQLIREGNHGTTIHFGSDGAQHMFWPLGRSRILHAGA